MEELGTSKTSINICQTTLHNNREGSHPRHLLLFPQIPRMSNVLWLSSSRFRRRREENHEVAVRHRAFLRGHSATWRRPPLRNTKHSTANSFQGFSIYKRQHMFRRDHSEFLLLVSRHILPVLADSVVSLQLCLLIHMTSRRKRWSSSAKNAVRTCR